MAKLPAKRTETRGARKRAAAPMRPHKWAGNLDAFPIGWDIGAMSSWVDSCLRWADQNQGDVLYRSYASIVQDAAGKCLAPLALWTESRVQPGDLMGCALRLAEVVHWVHMFWAGIPVPALQQRAAAASATVRGERKKVLVEFAKRKNILPTHAGKVYIAARRAGVIRSFDGKEFVVSPTGEKVGQPLPDTQNPLKDILRK